MKKLFFLFGFIAVFSVSTAFADSLDPREIELCRKAWKNIEMTPEEIENYYNIPSEERYDAIRKLTVGSLLTSKEYDVFKKVWKKQKLSSSEQDIYDSFSKTKRKKAFRKFLYAPSVLADPYQGVEQTTDYSF